MTFKKNVLGLLTCFVCFLSGCNCFRVWPVRTNHFVYHEKPPLNPRDVMVNVINQLGFKLLAIHNENNNNNIAISPYGAISVLSALTEGMRGGALHEILHATNIPDNKYLVRVGLRDVHRHLKSYFLPQEGFLAGLMLNYDNITLNEDYEKALKFYGYDYQSFNNALYPEPLTTGKPASTTDMIETTTETPTSIFSTSSGNDIAENTPILTTLNKTDTEEITTTVGTTSMLPEVSTKGNIETTETFTTEATTIPSTTIVSTIPTSQKSQTIETTGTTDVPIPTTTTETVIPSSKEPITNAQTQAASEEPLGTTTEVITSSEGSLSTTTVFTSSEESSISTTDVFTSSEEPTRSTTAVFSSSEEPTRSTIDVFTSSEEPTRSTTDIFTFSEEPTRSTTDVFISSEEPTKSSIGVFNSSEESSTLTTDVYISSEESTGQTTEFFTYESTASTTNVDLPSTGDSLTTTDSDLDKTTTTFDTSIEANRNTRNTQKLTTKKSIPSTETETHTPSTVRYEEPDSTTPSSTVNDFDDSFHHDAFWDGTSTQNPKQNDVSTRNVKRRTRSLVDYIIATYYDERAYIEERTSLEYRPPDPSTFLVYGTYKETGVNFMKYDTVLPFSYIPQLNSLALKFPLDSAKYYLLLVMPVDPMGINRLICQMRYFGSLKDIIRSLRLTHVVATIPSFMLKGYVILTPTLQKLGIKRMFEPRQADFTLMTNQTDIYVTNIEQAITVNIRNYVESWTSPNYGGLHHQEPVYFKGDHPFLYFVVDADIHVTLMAGKIVNPLNSRIR